MMAVTWKAGPFVKKKHWLQHTRLRARDHAISSALIGGKAERAGPPSLIHTALEGPTEYVTYVSARWMLWSVEFEKQPVEVQDCMKITDRFGGIYRIYPYLIKENRRMSTYNRLDLHTRGSQPVVMPKNLPDHWMDVEVYVDSYVASNGSCFMVTGTGFENRLLEVGLTQNGRPQHSARSRPLVYFYFIMCEDLHA